MYIIWKTNIHGYVAEAVVLFGINETGIIF